MFRTIFTTLTALLKSDLCATQLCIRSDTASYMNRKSNQIDLWEGRIARADSTADPRLLPRLIRIFYVVIIIIMCISLFHQNIVRCRSKLAPRSSYKSRLSTLWCSFIVCVSKHVKFSTSCMRFWLVRCWPVVRYIQSCRHRLRRFLCFCVVFLTHLNPIWPRRGRSAPARANAYTR